MNTELTRARLIELANFKPTGANTVNSATREEWMEMARQLLAMGWVSVNQRLPEPDEEVIAYTEVSGIIYDMMYRPSHYPDTEWMTRYTQWGGTVLFWMEKPAYPNVEDDSDE